MSLEQAIRISGQFKDFYKQRSYHEEILRAAGHSFVAQGSKRMVLIENCTNATQIAAFALKIYFQAHRLVGKDKEAILEERKIKEAKQPTAAEVRKDWANHLYEIFNIFDSQKANINPEDLEAQLLE